MEFHIEIVDLPYTTTPQSKYGYATSQATKKVQNLNMSAPPPRPRRRRALASAAERDGTMDSETRNNFIWLADDGLHN
jgi:hypothetical protein